MKLIVILICLWMERYLAWGSHVAELRWLEQYLTFMQDRVRKTALGKGILKPVICIGTFSLLAGGLSFLIRGWILGSFVLNIIFLLFCFGKSFSENHKKSLENILWSSYEQFFAVIFWYILLGPFGMFLYRLSTLYLEMLPGGSDEKPRVEQWVDLLDWLPLRVQSLLYGLVGNFGATFGYWVEHVISSPRENKKVLTQCGAQSLMISQEDTHRLTEEQQNSAHQLSDRTLVILLVTLALVMLGSIMA